MARAFVLDPELGNAEPRGESRRAQERSKSDIRGEALRRLGGQQLAIPPEVARAARQRLARE
jgi:hypothetical protein